MRIENDKMILEIKEMASEITSFRSKETGLEYMWQGDPAFWSGRNPTLFPMVGSTWNKKIEIDGKTYEMGNHGFCRHSNFTCISQTEDQIVMNLKSSEETLAQYPYDFDMKITYTLKDTKVHISYVITNTSDKKMPFNFGLHPAFNCPLEEGEKFEDYRLSFSVPEQYESDVFSFEGKDLPLTYDMFEKVATLILEHPNSSYVSLTNDKHELRVHYSGYRWLAFWTKQTGAPFVCIEPWHGHTDFTEVHVPFDKREGTQILEPGRSFTTEYEIEVIR